MLGKLSNMAITLENFVVFLKCLFINGCAGSSLLCGLFSSCGQWGLLSSCSVQASRCGGAEAPGRTGFRNCCSQALEHMLWFMGWVAPWHVGSSRTRDCTHVSCTGRQTSSPLSHQGSLRILFLSGGDRHVLFNDHTVCRFCSGGDGYKALCEQGKQGWEVETNCGGWEKLHSDAAIELTEFGSPTPRFCNSPGERYS